MKRHVSLIVIPIDDVTNQVVNGNYIKPAVKWEQAAIWKRGYYIFVNMKQKVVTLQVESELYQPQEYLIEIMDGETKIVKLRMVPSERYAVPPTAAVVYGTAKPGKTVAIYSSESIQYYKLVKDYLPGEKLGIFHPQGCDFGDKKIWIQGREKSQISVLGEQSEEEERFYEVDGITEKLRKVETDIYLVNETKVREDGTFYLLVPRGKEQEFSAMLCYEGKEEKILLQSEQRNQFHL